MMIQTYSILHKLPLCVFYQHVSHNNVFLSSHIFSLQSLGHIAKEYGQNCNPKLQKQPDFPSKWDAHKMITLDHFWICKAELKSECCPDHMIQCLKYLDVVHLGILGHIHLCAVKATALLQKTFRVSIACLHLCK